MVKKRNFSGGQKKKETTQKKKIKIEFPPSLQTVIKEEINIDEENTFLMDESPSSFHVNCVTKDNISLNEDKDDFTGFSSDERESSNAKAIIMQKLLIDDVEKENSVEVHKEGNKNVTCTQKIIAKGKKFQQRQQRKVNIRNPKIKIECQTSNANVVVKEELEAADGEQKNNPLDQDISSDMNTILNEDIIQGDLSCRTGGIKLQMSNFSESKSNSSKQYKCDSHKVFTRLRNLSTHKLIHDGVKKHECDIYKKAFTQKCNLSAQKLIHSGEKKYQCDICSKAFCQKSNLLSHNLIHSGKKKYQCDICNKVFSHNSTLLAHNLIHCDEKKYESNVCKKTFNLKSNLVTHNLVHCGKKKYKCDVCNKYFNWKNNLTTHNKLMHKDVQEYQCDICKKIFAMKRYLLKHILNHYRLENRLEKYECNVCNRVFTWKGNLRRHKFSVHKEAFNQKNSFLKKDLIHHTIKKYECDVCKKTFIQKSNMKVHKLTHSGIKKYKCDVCSKAFTVKHNLLIHKCLTIL